MLSNSFDRVLLSTDSEEIAEIGIKFSAEVPFLRKLACDDHSTSEATLAVIKQKSIGENFAVVAQLMAPVRTSACTRWDE